MWKCTRCKSENTEDAIYCKECGLAKYDDFVYGRTISKVPDSRKKDILREKSFFDEEFIEQLIADSKSGKNGIIHEKSNGKNAVSSGKVRKEEAQAILVEKDKGYVIGSVKDIREGERLVLLLENGNKVKTSPILAWSEHTDGLVICTHNTEYHIAYKPSQNDIDSMNAETVSLLSNLTESQAVLVNKFIKHMLNAD